MPLVGYLSKFHRKYQISIFCITIGAALTIIVLDLGKIIKRKQPQVEYQTTTRPSPTQRRIDVTLYNIISKEEPVKGGPPLLDKVFPVPKVSASNLVSPSPTQRRIDVTLYHIISKEEPVKGGPPLLDKVLPVPKVSASNLVSPLNYELMKSKLKYPHRSYTEQVIILTPVHDVAKQIPHFVELLKALTYPHHLITIVFGEDSSEDNTFHVAEKTISKYQREFKGLHVVHFNITGAAHGTWTEIHNKNKQLARRAHLAEARNLLVKTALRNESWVLWIDIIKSFPVDIIQQLLSAQRDIVVPLCLFSYENDDAKYVYDKNTWRETAESLKYQKQLAKDQIMLEGYDETRRIYLHDLRAEGRVVPIDGIGGCCLLIRADCHKKGLKFPTKLYKHHIETEGLAKMAVDMQFTVGGMPFVEVFHN